MLVKFLVAVYGLHEQGINMSSVFKRLFYQKITENPVSVMYIAILMTARIQDYMLLWMGDRDI